jgi:hypothetical protein
LAAEYRAELKRLQLIPDPAAKPGTALAATFVTELGNFKVLDSTAGLFDAPAGYRET